MPRETIYENYKALKQAGIIKGATIHINYKIFGYKAVANLLITADPSQADQLIEYFHKIPDVYHAYKIGPGGDIRVVATLKTLHQLDEIKDTIKQKFSIMDIKTGIWTDVKETHENLTITSQPAVNFINKPTIQAIPKQSSTHNTNIKIDKVDLQIAEMLATNGRAPLSKIAQQIGISTNSAIKRYQNLKENGIIKVTIQIDPQKIGYHAMVIFYTAFTLQADSLSIIKKISQMPDIISIMKISGDYDLQIYAVIKDIEQLLVVQEEFAKIPGIAKMHIDISRMPHKWPTPRQYISTF